VVTGRQAHPENDAHLAPTSTNQSIALSYGQCTCTCKDEISVDLQNSYKCCSVNWSRNAE